MNGNKRTFEASGMRASIGRMGYLTGLGGGVVMTIIGVLILNGGRPVREIILPGLLLTLNFPVLALCYFVGNIDARIPFKVIVDEGKGVWLVGVARKVYVSTDNLRDVRASSEGIVVRLKRRQRLLRSFVIHRQFGKEAGPLIEAVEREIQNLNSRRTENR